MGRKIAPKSAERPATLPSDQAAKLLRVQYEKGKMIEANRPISSPSVNAWTTATLEALENAFGSAAPCVQIFTDVDSYHYGGGNEQTWEAVLNIDFWLTRAEQRTPVWFQSYTTVQQATKRNPAAVAEAMSRNLEAILSKLGADLAPVVAAPPAP